MQVNTCNKCNNATMRESEAMLRLYAYAYAVTGLPLYGCPMAVLWLSYGCHTAVLLRHRGKRVMSRPSRHTRLVLHFVFCIYILNLYSVYILYAFLYSLETVSLVGSLSW